MNLEHKLTLIDLIEGCKKQSRKAQEAVYKLFAGKMLGVCARYARDRFEAEDMLQVGFLRVFEKMGTYKGDGSFEGWVRRIMVNTAIEFYRKNMRMLPVVDIDNVNVETGHASLPSHRLHTKDLLNIIQQLSPGYRVVFNMHAIEGYSHREIAEQLGISEGTSKSQLARARMILQEQVKNMEGSRNESIA